MNSIHTLSYYLIFVLILSFYLHIGILRVSSQEVTVEKTLYVLFVLMQFSVLILTTFDSSSVSVAVLVDSIEGVRHVSCHLEDARLLSDVCIHCSVSRNVQNRRERRLGATGLSQSW